MYALVVPALRHFGIKNIAYAPLICHVEPAETSSRKAHFRYARFFDYAQNDKENFEFYRLFQIGCGCPTLSNNQADNLAKLQLDFFVRD